MTDYDSACELIRRQSDLLKEKDREIKVLKRQWEIFIKEIKAVTGTNLSCGHCPVEQIIKYSHNWAESEVPK